MQSLVIIALLISLLMNKQRF